MTIIPLCPGCKTTAPTLALTDGLWCAQCGYLARRNAAGAMEFHAPVQARNYAALREAAVEFRRHACRPGDDGEYDDGYDESRAALDAALTTEPPKE